MLFTLTSHRIFKFCMAGGRLVSHNTSADRELPKYYYHSIQWSYPDSNPRQWILSTRLLPLSLQTALLDSSFPYNFKYLSKAYHVWHLWMHNLFYECGWFWWRFSWVAKGIPAQHGLKNNNSLEKKSSRKM